MVLGNIKNADMYLPISKNIKLGLSKIAELEGNEIGKYEIDGKTVYASVQEYTSKTPDVFKYENHQKYIDIQYIIDGCEEIRVEKTSDTEIVTEYNPDKDIEFYSECDNHSVCKLTAGDFMILFPGEAHAPGLAYNGVQSQVKKIVVKIAL